LCPKLHPAHPPREEIKRRPKKRSSLNICTGKKEEKIFLIYKEIQMGSGAKSYMRKDFLTYEEMR